MASTPLCEVRVSPLDTKRLEPGGRKKLRVALHHFSGFSAAVGARMTTSGAASMAPIAGCGLKVDDDATVKHAFAAIAVDEPRAELSRAGDLLQRVEPFATEPAR